MASSGSQKSRTQIDHLGNRLRAAAPNEDDLHLLDEYRRSFHESYEHVVQTIRSKVNQSLTGRPAKSTTAICEKLRRESIRLTQMQDIAGCRIIVIGIGQQDDIVDLISALFGTVTVVDRRKNPSHGYRAVHVIAHVNSMPVEIQIRTERQHRWAELSEKLANDIDPRIKYGQGPRELVDLLQDLSAKIENLEVTLLSPVFSSTAERIEWSKQISMLSMQIAALIAKLERRDW